MVEIDRPNIYGKYPIHIAISSHQYLKAKNMIYSGIDVNIVDSYGMTPLMYACRYKSFGIMKLLIRYGANINAEVLEDNALSYSLSNTSRKISSKIAHYLIENGINITMKNLYYSIINRYRCISNIIVDRLTFDDLDNIYILDILKKNFFLISKHLFKKMIIRGFKHKSIYTSEYNMFMLFNKYGIKCSIPYLSCWYPLSLTHQDNDTLIAMLDMGYGDKISDILCDRVLNDDEIRRLLTRKIPIPLREKLEDKLPKMSSLNEMTKIFCDDIINIIRLYI